MSTATIRPIVSIGAVSIATLIANAGAPTHTWLNPVNGNWTDPANWDAGSVPGVTSEVLLGLVGAYTVNSTGNINAMNLSIANPDATLFINNANTFDLFGDLFNDGQITVNTGGGSATQIDFESDSVISGTGELRLNAFDARARLRTGAGFTVTQQPGHTIAGWGKIEANLINNGLVNADTGNATLTMDLNPKANNATMRASNDATLEFISITVTQGPAGLIEAVDPGSEVRFSGTTLEGGQLRTDADGVVSVVTSVFDGVTLTQGNIRINNAGTLDVFNTLTNNATLTINPGGNGSATQLDFENTGSFLGNGTVVLDSFSSRARLRTAPDATMTNSAGHTIRGWGQIEADFINNGLVSADKLNESLILLTNDKVNNATMRAIDGGTLDFSSILIDQTGGGQIAANGAGSQIEFNSTTVLGGQVGSINGATIEILNATFDGVMLEGIASLANGRTLDVFNSLTNNGLITVNPGGNGSATQIDFENSGALLGNGTVLLDSLDSRARLRTAAGATMTNSATHTIRGWGQIEAALINDGEVIADEPGQAINMNLDDKVNNSTMRAVDTGSIVLSSITLDQSAGGQLFANGLGSMIEIRNSTVLGGDIAALNDAAIDTFGATLDAVNFGQGVMRQANGTNTSIFNSITNDGEIVINPLSGGSATTFDFQNTGALNGSGSIRLNSFDARAWVRTLNDARLTNTANHTIRGYGRMAADLINNGLVSADVLDNTIFFNAQPIENNSTIEAINGAEADFSGISIDQSGGGVIRTIGDGSTIDFTSTTVLAGLISATDGAVINASNSTFDGVELAGVFNAPNAGNNFIRGGVTNNATITVNTNGGGSATQLQWQDDSTLGGTGTVRLNSFDARSWLSSANGVTMGTMGPGQRLEGIGRIGLPLELQGTHAPGLSVGTMLGTHPLTYTDSTTLEIEVNADSADLYDSSSTVALDGTLDVTFVDGFSPTGFWARTIIEGSDITGKFDAVNIPEPAPGLVSKVINTGTEVLVGHTCPGDFNLDGLINFFDVSIFLIDFNNQNPAADLNNDQQWNFFDVSAFLAAFTAGC